MIRYTHIPTIFKDIDDDNCYFRVKEPRYRNGARIHLCNRLSHHIEGYYLLCIDDEGMELDVDIGKNFPPHKYIMKQMDLNEEYKLKIVGMDVL